MWRSWRITFTDLHFGHRRSLPAALAGVGTKTAYEKEMANYGTLFPAQLLNHSESKKSCLHTTFSLVGTTNVKNSHFIQIPTKKEPILVSIMQMQLRKVATTSCCISFMRIPGDSSLVSLPLLFPGSCFVCYVMDIVDFCFGC